MTKPFPFPDGYWMDLSHKLVDRSLRDYVAIFAQRRNERPNGRFDTADIEELMRLAEDLDTVDGSETAYLLELARTHPDYFADAAQKQRLELFARTHDVVRKVSKDEFTKDLIGAVPVTLFREPAGIDYLNKAQALSEMIKLNESYHDSHGTFDPAVVQEINKLALELRKLVDGLTLSDVDKPGSEARASYLRDLANLLARTTGHTDHESKWDDGEWFNWNRDVVVYPEHYEQPRTHDELRSFIQHSGPVRMVAGGHAFNIGSSMGGTHEQPVGTLITLDKHELSPNKRWIRIDPPEAVARYKVSADQANRVVRASAGIRLRDFGKMMWAEGMALPVAGSTDAQSLGGLVASDLHSTGKKAGFLSPQLLELTVFSGSGETIRFVKDEGVPRGQIGRWTWTPPGASAPQHLTRLPVAGALGVLGVVAEIVLKLDVAYNMYKVERFVPRDWAEDNLERFLNVGETDPLFAYDHVSFYYAGGGEMPKTVRLNGWRRTTDPLSPDGYEFKTIRELIDLVGSGFLPAYLLRLSQRQAPVPGQSATPSDDGWIATLNKRKPLVLQANEGFARKLFFQHDEIEVGIPIPDYDVARSAIHDVLELLKNEEFRTIIEVRFTPDLSEAMLGPGTGGPTCYIELASAFGEHSKARIVEVYDLFDRTLREKYRARPHLGKKTSVTYADMESLYGPGWQEFQAIRALMDPANKFFPEDNPLLKQIFLKPA